VALVALVGLESLVVPVLLLVAVESLVTLGLIDWIIVNACGSVEKIEAALAILAVRELMEEEMVLEVVGYNLFAFEPKKLIILVNSRNINSNSIRKNYFHYL
jgi:hypothetical protein